MRVAARAPHVRTGRVMFEMKEGLRYVMSQPLVRSVLLLLAITSVLAGSYSTLLPLVAGDTLGGGPHTLGILMGSAGLGALTGALYLASRNTVRGLGRVIAGCAFGLGSGLVVLEFAHSTWVAAPILFVVGGCLMVQMASTNTIVQTVVDPDKLGRVMSLYAVAFFGGAPLGAVLEGKLADHIGPINMFAVAGAGCLVCAITFARALPNLRVASRPLYVRLGIIDGAE